MSWISPPINLVKNILAGTRAALFMPIQLWQFKSGYLQVCLLLIISLALSVVYDYFDTAPDNYFNPYGLSYQALLYLSFFFSLSLVAVFNSRQRDFAKLVVLFLSIVPVIWLGSVCLLIAAKHQPYFDGHESNWAVFIIYSAWYLLVVGRLFKRFFYLRSMRIVPYVLLYAVINFAPLFLLPAEPLWYPRQADNKETEKLTNLDIETIYYSQRHLLEKRNADLVSGKEGITEMFYIGFAGDADEDVFMNEAMAAQDIVNNYFDGFGHSKVLINNVSTVKNVPLANSYNLKSSIRQTAELMNKSEDILFLFLTSHGSENHTLSANFPPFKLNNINARTIKKALDEAAVKWRIIIISACYSGGFIEPLASPTTLLITAASADRNSFGCGHDGKYTYFGDAYFEKGLKQTRSFIKAYAKAAEIIHAREKKEGFKNSDPQIRIGDEMKIKLIDFEKTLEKKRSSNWASTAAY